MKIALITAAGIGSRFGSDIPKQFIEVYNKPVIIYTLEKFQNNKNIDAIIVACLNGWEEKLREYAKIFNITKLKWIVTGGSTVVESIYNCLLELSKHCDKEDIILQHSGDRCLISDEIIEDALDVYNKYNSAIASVPSVDYMLLKDKEENCIEIPREKTVKVHTPNVFSLGRMLDAYEKAKEKNITNAKTLCDLMVKLNEKIYFSKSNSLNMKLTTKEDLEILKSIIYNRKKDDGGTK